MFRDAKLVQKAERLEARFEVVRLSCSITGGCLKAEVQPRLDA